MTIDRRTFLGGLAAGAMAAPAALRAAQGGTRRVSPIGLQLYTVRTEMQKDFEGTLARVASIGYTEVEFAGYFDHTPADVRAILGRHGLKSPSTHIGYDQLDDKWPGVVEASKTIGHQFIVMPYLDDDTRKDPDIWKKAAEKFNRAGEISKRAGIQFAYHNHNFEFGPEKDGTLPYDYLLAHCDPSLVKFELDLCWIVAGGQDPAAYFRTYPGRFPMVHVKDLKRIPPPASAAAGPGPVVPDVTDVGSGVIDWRAIFAKSSGAGIQHYFVEHDQPPSPFDSAQTSFKYLQALRY